MAKIRELSFEQRVAVKYLRESGLSYREIGRQIGCHHSTALRIHKRFALTGSVAKQDRPGRPSKFDERGERTICRAARRLRFSTLKTVVSDVQRSHRYRSATVSLVRKILHKYKLQSFQRKRKPYVSVKNRAYRLQWAKALGEWPAEFWNDVVFSDECRFGLKNDSRTLRVWRMTSEAENPEFFQPSFKNSLSVMFWGCIGPNGIGRLVICDQKMNAAKYVSLLRENLPQSISAIYGDEDRPYIFQQDNAPPHRANITKNFCQQQGINLLPWPAQSPDLNVIENVWQFMKNKMNFDPRGPPTTKNELIQRVEEVWQQIPCEYLRKLYESIPRRLAAVQSMRGYPTKY